MKGLGRIVQGIRDVERLNTEDRPEIAPFQDGPHFVPTVFVKVTGAVDEYGNYPGIFVYPVFSADTTRILSFTEVEQAITCTIVPKDGQVLTNGQEYRGIPFYNDTGTYDYRAVVMVDEASSAGVEYTDCDSEGIISLVSQTIGDGDKIFQQNVIAGYKTGVDVDDVAIDEPTYVGGYVVYTTSPYYIFFNVHDEVDSGVAAQGVLIWTNGNTETVDGHGGSGGTTTTEKSIDSAIINGTYPATLRCMSYDMTGSTDSDAKYGDDKEKTAIAACRIHGNADTSNTTRFEVSESGAVWGGTTHTNTLGMSSKGGIIYQQIAVEGPELIGADLSGVTYNSDAEDRINELSARVNSLINALRDGGWWTAP